MKLSFLGGYEEVGRNAVLIESNERILLDYGIKVQEDPIKYPGKVNGKLNALLLSHSHLDHIGSFPILFAEGQDCPVYAPEITRMLSRMLLKDSIKVAKIRNIQQRFSEDDMRLGLQRFKPIKYRKEFKIGSTQVMAFDAGHVSGSCMFFLNVNGKKILYTGDLKMSDTQLLRAADTDLPDIDILITETTYSGREHLPRKSQEKELVETVRESLANDGTAVIACFALGRTQEVLLVLEEYGIDYPLYIDGMAQRATKIINAYPELQKTYNSVKMTIEKNSVKFVEKPGIRRQIIKNPSVVLTTSGMLQGGPVAHYIRKLHKKEECSLIMTGFQAEGSPGRALKSSNRYVNEELNIPVKMTTKFLDFSSHASGSDLVNLVKKTNPETVFCIHGDDVEGFTNQLKGQGFYAVAPTEANRTFNI